MSVSVIIPAINDPSLGRTIENLRQNAEGEVEFVVINDGGGPFELKGDDIKVIVNPVQRGRRVSINDAAKISRGDYLFIIDAHCSMSKGWDVRMIDSVREKNLVYCVIRDMNKDTWQHTPGDYMHVYMNQEYTEKWWPKKTLAQCALEEESMCITGCSWMVTKKRYWELGGYDEYLGMYGWDGPEWSCKIQLSDDPGKVILRTDVICGHIFGTNNKSLKYPCKMIPKQKYIEYMKNKWGSRINALVERFKPIPGWHGKELTMKFRDDTGREVKLETQKIRETKNEKGEVVKRVVEYYEYIYKDDGTGPSEEEIREKYRNEQKLIRTDIWELKDGQLQKVA